MKKDVSGPLLKLTEFSIKTTVINTKPRIEWLSECGLVSEGHCARDAVDGHRQLQDLSLDPNPQSVPDPVLIMSS